MSPSIFVAIPHAGLAVPEPLALRLAPWFDGRFFLAQSDAYSDRVYGDLGVPTLKFPWSRLLVDPNRSPDSPTVVPKEDFEGRPIYPVPLSPGVRQKLVDELHRPYHEQLERSLLGRRLWIDGHAMAAVAPGRSADAGSQRPLAIVGNRGDERGEGGEVTCAPAWARRAREALAARLFEQPAPDAPGLVVPQPAGEPVRLNHVFRGGHGIQRHRRTCPGIQLELNQGLWCCPRSFRLDEGRLAWIRRVLKAWLADLERMIEA